MQSHIISFRFLICACALCAIVSCGSGEGVLTIVTTPVPGKVQVDGNPVGETPVTLTMEAGVYSISFSPYSDQYIPPEPRSVKIESGTTLTVAGEYQNRFIPSDPPRGFSPADSLRVYGTTERKLKDGTIFDYIDGGGLVYLRYGLVETTHSVYRDDEGSEIMVDIFDMGTLSNAEAAFNDEEICPSGYTLCDLGAGCKSYAYEPDFLIYFHKSRYLVLLSTTNDLLKETVVSYAERIESSIP
ncbi:MAG TPA: DUF6599 family protein [Anaerolineae bacterium]|nr:DUF6599 family protein [Anaerolineae bacterium]